MVNLTDAAGTVTESYTYDEYGRPLSSSFVGNRYFFTGREYDKETGLYYYRARYYDPAMGRFLTQDPIGYAGGMNLYGYCGNNPVNFVDPWGLYEVGPGGMGNFAAEILIRAEIKKYSPEMPDGTMAMAAKVLRKEMTVEEYKKLKDQKLPEEQKAKITKDIIKRAQEKPENQELKEELKPYLLSYG